MGVPLQDGTVHKGARVSLIDIAYHIFLVPGDFGRDFPLQPCGEPAATASPKPRFFDLLNNLHGLHLRQTGAQSHVAVMGDVFINLFRIDKATVP